MGNRKARYQTRTRYEHRSVRVGGKSTSVHDGGVPHNKTLVYSFLETDSSFLKNHAQVFSLPDRTCHRQHYKFLAVVARIPVGS